MPSSSSSHSVDAVLAAVRAIETRHRQPHAERLRFGIPEVDERLGGNGLAIAALHEMTGASGSLNDDAAATLFAAGLAAQRVASRGTMLWVLKRRDLFAPSLAQAGLPPGRIIYAECMTDEDVLTVMEEGLRHGGLAAVVGEVGRATMSATRRLQLVAEDSGTIGLMLRRWRKNGEDPLAAPSAAVTRWRIGCVPSAGLPVGGIARPRWQVELARQRGGPPHQWILEGTDEAGRLALPAEPSHRSAAADRGEKPGLRAA